MHVCVRICDNIQMQDTKLGLQKWLQRPVTCLLLLMSRLLDCWLCPPKPQYISM